MLTIKQIRDDKQAAIRKLAKKGVDAAPVIARIETLDDRRKAIQTELDNTLAAQNKAAKEIGALMGQGRRDEAEERKRFVADLKEKSNRLQAESHNVQEELQAAIVSLPNFPADIVPEGKTAEDNLVVKLVESYTQLPENPLPHWELARKYDIIDFDLGVKLTGAGFPCLQRQGSPSATCADQLFPRLQHPGRLPRSGTADHGQRSLGLRHGPAARQGGADVPRHGRQFLHDPDGRSTCDEHLPRRDPRRKGLPGEDDRLYPLLPPRSRLVRQGRARTEPPAPVRQRSKSCS